ncbi:MAG: DUF2141 domain-containing protein [Alphaproteobacteria bacterium]
MKHILMLVVITMAFSAPAYAADLTIKLTDLRNKTGNIAIAIYEDSAAFKENKVEHAPYTMLLTATGTQSLTLHSFPVGTYAISILHDENKNGALDMSKYNFPTEGYAYSNNVGKMSIPSFEKASFIHSGDTNTEQTIQIIYIK